MWVYHMYLFDTNPITCLDKDGADGMVAPRLERRWVRYVIVHIWLRGIGIIRAKGKPPELVAVGDLLPAAADHSYRPLF